MDDLSCMGFSIGLGNVWRFPYLCYKNGGGAFLIPYFISVFLAGVPLFLLEVTVGQLTRRGVIAAWNICPLFQGIGYACTLINFFLNCYYTVILAWAFHFIFSSFTSQLPWTRCDQAWNTPACRVFTNQPTNSSITRNTTFISSQKVLTVDATTEYWEHRVLRISDGIHDIGVIQWDLALCLLLTWTVIFLCIWKGIKTSAKIMYVTSLLPYVFMITLLIRTTLLEGASYGLLHYLKPNWSKLTDLTVWSDAGTQIFFSYSIGLGVLTAFGSYNKFHHNSLRDCCLFAMINTFTSLLSGCVVFSTLGYMSYISNIPLDLIAESGPGMGYVVYPKAIGTMPGSQFWSICFFSMVILLGIDSMFAGVEGFIAAAGDYFPHAMANKWIRCMFVGCVCITSYLVGLSMVTNGGMYIFLLFDYYSGSRIILIVGLLEALVIGYIYGYKRIANDMKLMFGFSLKWIVCLYWCILTPIFTLTLFIISVIVYEELTYKRASLTEPYQFPGWSVKVGWLMASSSVFLIPFVMIIKIFKTTGTFIQRIKTLCIPIIENNDQITEISSKYSSFLSLRLRNQLQHILK
ncbi:Sodium- and chloride-dependent GABA transporter 2 [Schistosoma japonicum]|uniref:Transporter n=1 Tax=Schistosoma japonicum TaxID=6182 RepID=A0A4Z2D0R2_SCHJA|nr:Sodium- and chloride-dependent GABA transporter 2 [Schistosoma japonicum]